MEIDPQTLKAAKAMTRVMQIAKACHEVNRAYCIGMDDHSHLFWYAAPDWQRDSAVQGVMTIIEFCAANNRIPTPEDLHIAWMGEKRAQGWVYGVEKDQVAKTHPCLVLYSELPAWQRMKDDLFLTTVIGLLAFDGGQDGNQSTADSQ